MYLTNFYLPNRQKNLLRWVNFTNLKTIGGILQNQNPRGLFATDPNPGSDYVIWQKKKNEKKVFCGHNRTTSLAFVL